MPLQWDQEKYTTGHAHIDEQHYELFDGLNSFLIFLQDADRINQPEEQEKAVELIHFLGEYAVRHFQDEEKMFAQCQHPLKEVNEEEHKRFVAKYLTYKKELTAGAITRASLIKLHIFLQSWLIRHILQVDTALRDYVVQDEIEQTDFTGTQGVFARFRALFQKKEELAA